MKVMTEDTKAILLLCGHLGRESETRPLNLRDYNQVVRWLIQRQLRPADLFRPEAIADLAEETQLGWERLNALLGRGVQLGFAVEKWGQAGIWVVSRSDPDYPSRYKTHLREKAPPILFGAGDRSLLEGGGLAIVGSRNVDAKGEAFASEVAAWCARGALPVVSGGAKGVDLASMGSALEAGGVAIGILAENLLRRSVASDARSALSDGRLLLISPYHPEARFTVGNAMGRNKLIYALADFGLVVATDHGKGGTWEGAIEELGRQPGRPVFVRLDPDAPTGNRKLAEHGAVPFPVMDESTTPFEVLQRATKVRPSSCLQEQLILFEESDKIKATVDSVQETVLEPGQASPPADAASAPGSIYEAVLPVILAALDHPLPATDLAKGFDVSKAQLDEWLKRAVAEHRIRKLTRPVRYARKDC